MFCFQALVPRSSATPSTLANPTLYDRPFSIAGRRLKSMSQTNLDDSGNPVRPSSRLSTRQGPIHWGKALYDLTVETKEVS